MLNDASFYFLKDLLTASYSITDDMMIEFLWMQYSVSTSGSHEWWIFYNWRFSIPADTRSTRVASALSKAQLQDGYVAYPWDEKMRDMLCMPNSGCYLSMLVLPKALDANACRYESFEDTLARANAWLYSSKESGVPINFMNVQSEALLTKVQMQARWFRHLAV